MDDTMRDLAEKKSGWKDWEVHDCLMTLVNFERTKVRVEKIRANKPLMQEISKAARRRVEEEAREHAALRALAGVAK